MVTLSRVRWLYGKTATGKVTLSRVMWLHGDAITGNTVPW